MGREKGERGRLFEASLMPHIEAEVTAPKIFAGHERSDHRVQGG